MVKREHTQNDFYNNSLWVAKSVIQKISYCAPPIRTVLLCLQCSSEIYTWAVTCDFQQCGILISVDSDEPVQPPVKLWNSKWFSVSSLTVKEYSSDKQRLWSDCAYAQACLSLCWSHILHRWKSHAVSHMLLPKQWMENRYIDCCAYFDSLHPSQKYFSHVGTGLPGLKKYQAADKVSCPRTRYSESSSSETQTINPSFPCLTLYHCWCSKNLDTICPPKKA